MAYQVIARKWRPQSFDDTVGQETVTRTLRNALKSGRIAHAFLFSGVRGVGKTTVARILAKSLNCHQGITDSPCGECPSCAEIRDGNSVDVHEIDAASNRGIDSIRELRESVRYGTARDRFKVFIVDEVHMLTNEAFNALLKTLEEPPAHVKFVLATTEFHKIPTTIASRCQKYEFKPIAYKDILDRLKLITQAEGVRISDYALGLVATLAQGSMRDAQSALEQLIAFGSDQVDDDDVKALLGVIDQAVVAELVGSVLARDRHAVISGIHELSATGVSAQMICAKLIERIRSLLVFKVAGWNETLLHLPDSHREGLEEQAAKLTEIDLIRFYDVLNRTSNELKWHSLPAIHLEISLLKLVEVSQLRPIEDVIRDLKSLGSYEAPASIPSGPPASVSPAPSPSAGLSSRAPIGFARQEPGLPGQETIRKFLSSVQENFRGLYTQLECASEIVYSDGRLRIRFAANDHFHARLLNDDREKLSASFASIAGSKPQVEVIVDEPTGEQARVPNPTEDPRVRAFIQRFPGKVVVKRENEE